LDYKWSASEVLSMRVAMKNWKRLKAQRKKEEWERESNGFHFLLFFYSLKNVYYITYCTCDASFSLFSRVRITTCSLLFLSFVTTKEKLFSNVLPTTFTFFGCCIAPQVYYQLFENMRFHSIEEVVVIVVFFKKNVFSFYRY
jgi:hypothetical protein